MRLPEAGAKQTWKEVKVLLQPQAATLVAVTVLITAGSATGLVVPALLGRIVDKQDQLLETVVAIAGAGTVAALLTLWGGRILVRTLQEALATLREDVFATAVRLEADQVENSGTSDVVTRVTGDVESVTSSVTGVIPRVVQSVFTLIVTAFGFAVLDPWLALAAVLVVPVQIIFGRWFLSRSRPLYFRQQRMNTARGQSLIETVTGADTVRAHGRERQRLDLIAKRSLASVEIGRKVTKVRNVFNGGLAFAEFLGISLILGVGFWRVDSAVLTIGAVTAGVLFFHRFFAPITTLLASIDDLQRAEVGLSRLFGVLQVDIPPERQPVEGADIKLINVTHTYPGRVHHGVDDVSLNIPAGSRVVLVGASGSGKSTMARLIAGFLHPDKGRVCVGGKDASAVDSVMLVTQEIHQFTGSIADNLRLAAPSADDHTLLEAMDAVGASWIYDYGLDNDNRLDESRIQQIALARVLLANPSVVILDEATAHAGTDHNLDSAVSVVVKGRTSVIVAHRLTQARDADLVVLLDQGKIIEIGSHESLIEAGQAYSTLWEAWTQRSSQRSGAQPGLLPDS
ncbi:multidrug ABC transporter ATPase/permease [Corynebacterium suranareeae]|uniref:Multidrug ABC transporter ATPase/permease n=1 Tax=Corynebacterium suranareeae TaxID=2506452 RepID=A0A160PQK7_9CORY|nr:ABC transporter ATP-binding protein [Corynebacterium suranareeae]BAU94530.1 multidrug ABC transporter ATPase/permease [Corynebacterium suranareeae]